jgi:nitroreductase
MDVWEAIESRRTIRTFTGRKIPKSDLERMVDAGRLALSARNEQRWDFIIVTQEEMLKQIISHFKARRKFRILNNGNFDGTSAIIAVMVDGLHDHWREDGSAATLNILLAARDLGWESCWIEGQCDHMRRSSRNCLESPTKSEFFF